MTKKEDKIKHELESNNLKLKETENEANLLNAQVERQERELKQRDASSKSDNVRWFHELLGPPSAPWGPSRFRSDDAEMRKCGMRSLLSFF